MALLKIQFQTHIPFAKPQPNCLEWIHWSSCDILHVLKQKDNKKYDKVLFANSKSWFRFHC